MRHALYTAAVYLGEVAGIVDDERDCRSDEASALAAAPKLLPEYQTWEIEDDEQLQAAVETLSELVG